MSMALQCCSLFMIFCCLNLHWVTPFLGFVHLDDLIEMNGEGMSHHLYGWQRKLSRVNEVFSKYKTQPLIPLGFWRRYIR